MVIDSSEKAESSDPEVLVGGNGNHHSHTSAGSEQNASHQDPEPPPEQACKPDVPPNGGFGWLVVACVSLINAHTWGINSASPDISSNSV